VEKFAQYSGGEVVGAHGGQGTAVAADRCADGVDDVDVPQAFVHRDSLWWGGSSEGGR
jgi:hypothetical protein